MSQSEEERQYSIRPRPAEGITSSELASRLGLGKFMYSMGDWEVYELGTVRNDGSVAIATGISFPGFTIKDGRLTLGNLDGVTGTTYRI